MANKVQADQTGAQDQAAALKGNKNTVNTGTTYNVSTLPEQQISGDGNTTSRTINYGLDAAGVGSLFDKFSSAYASASAPAASPTTTYSQLATGTPDAGSGTLVAPAVTMAAPNVTRTSFLGLSAWQLVAAALALAGVLFLMFRPRKKK